MKIRMDVDENLIEDEVIIRCSRLNEVVIEMQKTMIELISKKERFTFYKGEKEFYLPLEEVLFFESDSDGISAHTLEEVYKVKFKLYELEECLPGIFMRVSKSSILNLDKIYSIERKLTASSIVQFQHTHKQVYVSRHYYNSLKDRLEEKRIRR